VFGLYWRVRALALRGRGAAGATSERWDWPAMNCPNCGRSFNCEGPPECWCLKVEHDFDWEGFIMRTGITACLCPVCLTGKEEGGAGAGGAE
jgi:hypothetical protein